MPFGIAHATPGFSSRRVDEVLRLSLLLSDTLNQLIKATACNVNDQPSHLLCQALSIEFLIG